jgi:hypothetical protein
MADLKISALPASTVPLAGTEVLPIVQGATTKQVSVANLTAGRSINVDTISATGKITQVNGNSVPYTALTNGIPFVVPSSGLMGDDGALSGIAVVGAAYANAYVYLPANAISVGSAAGWYYAIFSSTSAATVYNNTYTTGLPVVPTSPTAFSTTGPGAYVQVAAPAINFNLTLPANTLTSYGRIEIDTYTIQTTGNAFTAIGAGSTYLQSNASGVFQSMRAVVSARGASAGIISCLAFTNANYNSTFAYGADSLASTISIQVYIRSLDVATTSVTLENTAIKIYP